MPAFKIYFASLDSAGKGTLWVTDGTASGTRQLATPTAGVSGIYPSSFAVLNGNAYFNGFDGSGRTNLFRVDGATDAVTEILPANRSASRGLDPSHIATFNGRLFFQGQDASGALGLFSSDGSATGTTELAIPNYTDNNFYAGQFTAFNGKLFFYGSSGVPSYLYGSDGTGAGTAKVAVTGNGYFGPSISSMTSVGTRLLFEGSDAGGKRRLYASNGTAAGTAAVNAAGVNPSGDYAGEVSGLLSFGARAAFTANDASGKSGIWVTDGTAGGTLELPGVYGKTYGAPMVALAGGRFAFIGSNAAGTASVYVSDGTAAGTAALAVVGANAAGLAPHALLSSGDHVLFDGLTASGTRALFASDGTTAGTRLVAAGVNLIGGNIDGDFALLGGTAVAVPAYVPPSYAIAATDASKAEGASGSTPFTFTVTRAGDAAAPATLSYAVSGTGPNPATADDFAGKALPAGIIGFAAGQTTATLTVNVSGDTRFEPDETFAVTLSGASDGTITTATAAGTIGNDDRDAGSMAFTNTTRREAGTTSLDAPDAGAPDYLQGQYIYAGSDDFAISAGSPNVFIHTGDGTDAIQVSSGRNVLDGGLGSNFLTGGSGTDTFFTDARAPGVVWNTLRNFHAGDAATLWGFDPAVSSWRWEAAATGAAGFEGATLRANIVGGNGRSGDGIDASITFTGISVEQAKNLQFATGTQPAGSYLYIYNPGV